MKLNPIAFAVAAACAAPAAFALTPAQMDTNTVRLWLSGASAPTTSVYKGALTLCAGVKYKNALGALETNPGANDVHLYQECNNKPTIRTAAGVITTQGILPGGSCSTGSSNDRMAYTCTVNIAASDPRSGQIADLQGKKVAIFHTVEGGSFNYVTPHIALADEGPALGVNGNPATVGAGGFVFANINNDVPYTLKRTNNIELLDDASGQCGFGAGTVQNPVPSMEPVDISGQSNTVGVYRGCATLTRSFNPSVAQRTTVFEAPTKPDGGFSDTEYLINKQNLNVVTDISTFGSEVSTNVGQAFGVAVSYPLYLQLQKNDIAAGKIDPTCDDAPFSNTLANPPKLTGLCQPSLAASKYTAIANADNIGAVDATLFGAASATPPGSPAKIILARRAVTSGTQSASNLRFLNKPCATGLSGGAQNPATASAGNVTVSLGSSTGTVKTNLNNATTAGQFGLGVVSMENVPGSSETWAFVKVDGASPNFNANLTASADTKQRQNALDGNYTFWYELVAFTATSNTIPEGGQLVNAVNIALNNPEVTDLTGLFITAAGAPIGSTAVNIANSSRLGNSCQPAF